jgi:hypothetical protein
MVEGINAMALGVYGLPFPVVGAIVGHAIADGLVLVLALCADLRVASRSSMVNCGRSPPRPALLPTWPPSAPDATSSDATSLISRSASRSAPSRRRSACSSRRA